jgi:hypothetical protein
VLTIALPPPLRNFQEAREFGNDALQRLKTAMNNAGASPIRSQVGLMHANLTYGDVYIYMLVTDEAKMMEFLRTYPFTTRTSIEKTTSVTERFTLK